MKMNINEETYFDKFKNLNNLSIIIKSKADDYEKAVLIRRIYPSLKSFKESFYRSSNSSNDKELTYILDDIFSKQEETIKEIENVYFEYESSGLLKKAKTNDKYLLRLAGNRDAREVILSYINDENSYDKDAFLNKHKLRAIDFETSVDIVKKYSKDLYKEYLRISDINKYKKIVVPIYNVFQIIEGIKTGKTLEGKKFDKYEFYKLAPFKEKNFDAEIKYLSKDYPNLSIFEKYKQDLKAKKENDSIQITYADNLYIFTCCFANRRNAETLRDWMSENNIKNLTPIFRFATVYCYLNGSSEEFFDYKDANEIFDIIEENNYPKIYEVFNMLKEEKIKKKKLLKENK